MPFGDKVWFLYIFLWWTAVAALNFFIGYIVLDDKPVVNLLSLMVFPVVIIPLWLSKWFFVSILMFPFSMFWDFSKPSEMAAPGLLFSFIPVIFVYLGMLHHTFPREKSKLPLALTAAIFVVFSAFFTAVYFLNH